MAFSTSRGGFQILQQPPQTTLLKKYTNLTPQAFPSGTLNYGAAVYIDDDGSLNLAKADIWQNAQTVGVVQGGYTASGMWTIEVVYQGEIEFPAGATSSLLKFPLVTGSTYYLSTGLSGGLTAGVPSTSTVVQPMLVATDSYSGVVVNGLPAASVLLGNTQVSIFSPVGTIVPFAGTPDKVPGNYLLCVGDSFPKGTTSTDPYNDLYNAIGEKYSILGLVLSGATGTTGRVRFDGLVDDSQLIPYTSPGGTKNHSILNNQTYKMVWGSKEAVVQVYAATGTSTDATFVFLKGITGWASGASSFSGLADGTEVILKSLKPSEVAGYTSDYFFVPDLRGRSLFGAGKGRGLSQHVLGEMGGEETHVLSLNEIPSHSHEIPIRSGVYGGYTPPGTQQQTIGSGVTASGVNSVLTNQYQANKAVTDVTGGSEPHQNLPPYVSANWIIRHKSNKGNPGVEVGPQGAAGIAGATGIPGVTGPTGVTGYSLGTLSYRYGSNSTVPAGYFWYDQTGRNFYINQTDIANVNLDAFFQSWEYSTSTIKGNLYIRDAITLDAIRILGITRQPSKSGSVYQFQSTLDLSGNLGFISPRLYNLVWVPTGNMGPQGRSITGPTGLAGIDGVTGPTGSTGATGQCVCDVSSWGDSDYKTVYLSNGGRLDGGANAVFPLNLSQDELQPSSFAYWNTNSTNQSSYKTNQPINLSRVLYNNWGQNISLKANCGGSTCKQTEPSVSYLSSSAASQSLEKAKGVQVVLASGSYTIDKPIYAENGNYHVCAGQGSYLEIDPLSLSASHNFSNGNIVNIEIFSSIDNISVGDHISLTPETFVGGLSGMTGLNTNEGVLSLCGIYNVTDIDSTLGKVTAQGIAPNGLTGATLFQGLIPENYLGFYRVYKTVLYLNNTNGFIVEPSATLTLGKLANGSGLPFLIGITGSSATANAVSAVICDGGKVNLENGMAVIGSRVNGSAIYASGGRVVADRVICSRNGTAVYAENSIVTLKSPVITQNAVGIFAGKNGVVNVESSGTAFDYSTIANNRSSAIAVGGELEITDPNFRMLVADKQQGILASNSSSIIISPSLTSSYSSQIVGKSSTAGDLSTDPQPIVFAFKDSYYQILANKVNGSISLTGSRGFVTSLTGDTFTFNQSSVPYSNQDLGV